jgi:hypothetical protein
VLTLELPLNVLTHLLRAPTRDAFLLTVVSQIVGAKSPVENTLELTDRVCDRYFISGLPDS